MSPSIRTSLILSLAVAACAPADPPPPEPLPRLEDPGANHNRIVGLYRGAATLPDGREVEVDLVAQPSAYAAVRMFGDGAVLGGFSDLPYDLGNGVLKLGSAFSFEVTGGSVFVPGVPRESGWTRWDYFADGTRTPFDVRLDRATDPLGGDNVLSVSKLDDACNALATPATFALLETSYAVPQAYEGEFSAQGLPSAEVGDRSLYFLLREIGIQDDERLRPGSRVTFPNENAQLNYSETQSDGTIRQWTAKAGVVVFDAVDGAVPAANGDESFDGKVTFHVEGLTLESANSGSDPRFTGAAGTCALSFSGTSSVGRKRFSRPAP